VEQAGGDVSMATPVLFSLSFEQLVAAIGQVHTELAAQASCAVVFCRAKSSDRQSLA